ncbi:C-type lectin domain family 4 member A-like isoform X2 [Triplophysa dalaica]|uniref:C-type lectin domain family 4 member A-like isoform X2 n=1 Tax=Triplophysa dalaica TaxID=1582913 RepID=UPI0024DF6F29|nr:C-type lectin domain family 4 member A-like isoform X2 [Triplophysa dalaica]
MEIMRCMQNRSAARNTFGPQTQTQNWTETKNTRRRWFVPITLCLLLIYVLLVVTLILLYISHKTERDMLKMTYMEIIQEYNETLNSMKVNCSHVTDEREELQENFNSMSQKNMELETRLKKSLHKGTFRYFVSNEKKSWTDSRQFCRDLGADLVIINTEEEQKYISSIIKEDTWIGLSNTDNKEVMKWVDNSSPNVTFWGFDEPRNKYEYCVQILYYYRPEQKWRNQHCTEERRWICEK